MKKLILIFLRYPFVARRVVPMVLKLHNLSYNLTGMLCSSLEPDGIHPKHRLMRYHDWFQERLSSNWHGLDVGCGNGALAYDLKSACRSVVAIDINPDNISRAKKQFSKEGITYICGDATTYHFNRTFDAIVLSNVLEHIEYRVEFLKQLIANQDQAVTPVLLIRVPMVTRDWITLYKKEIGVEWRLDHTHFIEYSEESFFEELTRAGLKIREHQIRFGELYAVVTTEGQK
jgi:SAM-dependent methyltransferase